MTQYLGDFANDSTIYIPWGTNDKDGGSITRATDGSIRIYKNNGTAEKTTANGVTDNEDFDTITGVHLIVIDTSIDTGDAGFWAAGNDYFVVLFGATIDGETVNHPIAHFSIENRFMRGTNSANTTTPPTAAAIADAVWDEPKSGHTTSGSFGEEVQAHALTSEIPAAAPTAAAIADAVWDEPKSGHTTGGSFGEEVQAHALTSEIPAAAPTAAAIADAVWDEAQSGHTTGGTFGEHLQGDMDSNITKVLGSTDAASGLHEIGNEYEDDFRIGADLVAIHGTSITEVTSGRIANNFDTFFENGDAATTKTVDDVGSGGGGGSLTQQQVRDAMKLAPTAGTPADGSVDDHLDDLVAFTPAAGAVEVTDIVVDSGGTVLEGAELWITTDSAGTNVVWSGTTDANGKPKDSADNNPWLDTGTYYLWVQHGSAEPPSLPITKVIS